MSALHKTKSSFEGLLKILSSLSENKHAGAYLAIAYLLIVLPLGLLLHKTGSYYITSENDFFSSYVPHAQSLLNGNFVIDVYRGPLYVLFLASVNIIFDNYMTAGVLISSLSSAVFLFVIYLTLKSIFSNKIAFAAVLLTSINPFFAAYSYAAGTDMFFNSLAASAIYFFLTADKNKKTKFILAGIFTALAFLTRYSAVFLLLSIPALILFTRIVSNSVNKKIIPVILFLAAFFIIVSPWGIYTYTHKGVVFYNENYRNLAISIGNTGKINWEKEWNKNSDKYGSLMEIIEEEPFTLAETVALNLIYHSYKNLTVLNTLHVGIFSVIGLIVLKKRKPTPHQSAFYLINLSFFLLLLPFFYDLRFPLLMIPLFTVYAYFGIRIAADLSRFSQSIILSGLLCFGIVTSISYNKHLITGQNEVKKTAEKFFLNNIAGSGKSTIASRMPHISYELKMKWKVLPAGKGMAETIAELKKKKVDYLYFSRREYNERKELRSLIYPAEAPTGLTPVVYIRQGPAVLYKINK
ncbi:MAG: glycosyltransferase family 39 protein [Ignavibacteriaceae bacterium]